MNEDSINVEIYFTIGHGHHADGVDGYQPGEHLVKVFEYITAQAGRTIAQVADQAYRIGNGVATGDEDHQLRCAYEGSVLRAVGVGDVVITGGVALACTPTGWRPITLPTATDGTPASVRSTRPAGTLSVRSSIPPVRRCRISAAPQAGRVDR